MKMKNERQRAVVKAEEDLQWSQAHQQAARSGIVLTKRKRNDGSYVCYLRKGTRLRSLLSL